MLSSIGNDTVIIITVGESKITLVNVRKNPPQVTVGESGTSGGISGGDNVGGSSGGDNGDGGGKTTGGGSQNEGKGDNTAGGNDNNNSSNIPTTPRTPVTPQVASTPTTNTTTPTINSTGYNSTVDNYASGEKIALVTLPMGYFFNGGNFVLTTAAEWIFSSTGRLKARKGN